MRQEAWRLRERKWAHLERWANPGRSSGRRTLAGSGGRSRAPPGGPAAQRGPRLPDLPQRATCPPKYRHWAPTVRTFFAFARRSHDRLQTPLHTRTNREEGKARSHFPHSPHIFTSKRKATKKNAHRDQLSRKPGATSTGEHQPETNIGETQQRKRRYVAKGGKKTLDRPTPCAPRALLHQPLSPLPLQSRAKSPSAPHRPKPPSPSSAPCTHPRATLAQPPGPTHHQPPPQTPSTHTGG